MKLNNYRSFGKICIDVEMMEIIENIKNAVHYGLEDILNIEFLNSNDNYDVYDELYAIIGYEFELYRELITLGIESTSDLIEFIKQEIKGD